jgi:SanA protein
MKYTRLIIKVIVAFLVISTISLIGAEMIVKRYTVGKTFNSTSEIPHNKVGVILGTNKYFSIGMVNQYYQYRIDAAVVLYNSGKIEYILVSGDNSTKAYNEPITIKNDLVDRGIPPDKIYMDFAGFRTLDSVVRCKLIFGQDSITVISQQFHNERAVFIANVKGIEAVGYNAKDVNVSYGFNTRVREKFARVKMILDLVFGKEPRYLGDKIEIKQID